MLLWERQPFGPSPPVRNRRASFQLLDFWVQVLSGFAPWAAAFVAGMRELGWVEGRTITIEYRWSEGRPERYAEIAAEFARLNVDVILTVGSAVPIVRQSTTVIPIVFAVGNRSGRQRSGRKSGETRRQRYRIVDPSERACRQAARILA